MYIEKSSKYLIFLVLFPFWFSNSASTAPAEKNSRNFATFKPVLPVNYRSQINEKSNINEGSFGETLFGIESMKPNRFGIIDPISGEFSAINAVDPDEQYVYLNGASALDVANHQFYLQVVKGFFDTPTTHLIAIDLYTGEVYESPSLPEGYLEIVHDPSSGQLYGVEIVKPNRFGVINPVTGQFSPISSVDPDEQYGYSTEVSALDVANHKFYLQVAKGYFEMSTTHLIAIDLHTGEVYESPSLSDGYVAIGFATVKIDSAITIISDAPDPSQAGEPVSITFTVSASVGTPSGTVTVTVAGEVENCSGTLASGVGECNITLDTPGTYILTASYSGDDHFLPNSATEQHAVVKSDSATVILWDDPDPSLVGQPIALTFEVTGDYGTPSGEVTVTVADEGESCSDTLTGGTGGCEISLNAPGAYTLMASYSGDDDFLPSSTSELHTVVKHDSAITILSDGPDPSQVGQRIAVTFKVTAGSGVPTGTVTVTVAAGSESCTDALVGGMGGCEIALNAPGDYSFSASYSGDDHCLPSSVVEPHAVVPVRLFLPFATRR